MMDKVMDKVLERCQGLVKNEKITQPFNISQINIKFIITD